MRSSTSVPCRPIEIKRPIAAVETSLACARETCGSASTMSLPSPRPIVIEVLVREPPRLQRMSLGRIQEMDDRTKSPADGWRCSAIPTTFPPGSVENAHHCKCDCKCTPFRTRNCAHATSGLLIGGRQCDSLEFEIVLDLLQRCFFTARDESWRLHSGGQIDTVMQEKRLFPPPKEFAAKARIKSLDEYQELWDEAAADPPKFWAELARDELHWFQPFEKPLVWKEPFAQWFAGGKTNVSYNCLDRNLAAGLATARRSSGKASRATRRTLTYAELHREVCKFANVLKRLGIDAGDRVSIYMPMVPELAIAMLACARIGAIHSVIFAGFSAEAIADRNRDAAGQAANHGRRRLAARQSAAAQGNRRRSARQESRPSRSASCSRRRWRTRAPSQHASRPRLLVARADGQGVGRLPRHADGQRSAAVHPLHQRLDRQTQGHQAHDGRLQPVRQENVPVGVRPSRRRHLLVHGRYAAGSPATATSSTARSRPARRC